MKEWIKKVYLALLGPNGKINNIDDFVVVSYYNKNNELRHLIVENKHITAYSNVYSLREFIKNRIKANQ
jgi:hypothetical protein